MFEKPFRGLLFPEFILRDFWGLGWSTKCTCNKVILTFAISDFNTSSYCTRNVRKNLILSKISFYIFILWKEAQREVRQDRLGACSAVGRGVEDCQVWRPLPYRPWGGWWRRSRPATRPWWWRSGAPAAGRHRGSGEAGLHHRNATRQRGRTAAQPAAGYWNCAWTRKKQEHPKFFLIFDNFINRKFFSLQKFVGQDNWSTKVCFSQGKTSVFPRLCTEVKEYKR